VTATPALHDLIARARTRLHAAGIAAGEAGLDARLLAQAVLGWDAVRIVTDGGNPPPAGFAAAYDALVSRRVVREPLAYITGRREFWGLDFQIRPGVLIPRPETELIVEAALEFLRDRNAPVKAADVCTGSGCLAVAIARDRPQATFIAADISSAAVEVARANAQRLEVADRVAFVASDLLSGVAGTFDLIVSNPPYVPSGDRDRMQPEVLDYEPPVALFAGADGLDIVRRLVMELPERLRTSGRLIFEIGAGQDRAAAALISDAPDLTLVEIRRDLQGIPRTVIARRD
jgi:release factor glutamine methyltransferase